MAIEMLAIVNRKDFLQDELGLYIENNILSHYEHSR